MRVAGVAASLSVASVPAWLVLAVGVSATACRDRRVLPFSSDSIWNMPIGSDAAFVAANVYAHPNAPPASFHSDQDFFVVATASDPMVDWIDQGDWGPDPKCAVTGKVAAQIPLPDEFNTTCVENNKYELSVFPPSLPVYALFYFQFVSIVCVSAVAWACFFPTTRRCCRCNPHTGTVLARRSSRGTTKARPCPSRGTSASCPTEPTARTVGAD
jgi:hypothetical protein